MAGKPKVSFYASKAMQEVIGGRPYLNPDLTEEVPQIGHWKGSDVCFWLSTLPQKTIPCERSEVVSIEKTLAKIPRVEIFSWMASMGNWWGETPGHQVPEPYEGESYTRFGPRELENLPGENWSFAHIVRDGRNQLESFRNLPGGIEQRRHKEDPKDYFIFLARGFRNRARVALDSLSEVPDFHLVRFESLRDTPALTMATLYEVLRLKPDLSLLKASEKFMAEERPDKQHSSFGGKEGSDQRWTNWTNWEKDTFKEIAGRELIELQYVTDNDW
jgi:hypothetical protein